MVKNEQKRSRFWATEALRGCNGAAVALQQAPRCDAIAAPLQIREGLTGSPFPTLFKRKVARMIISIYISTLCKTSVFLTPKEPDFSFRRIWKFGSLAEKFQKVPLKNGIKFGIFRTNVINRKHDDTNFGVINLLQEKAHDLIHALISHIDKKKCCICFIGWKTFAIFAIVFMGLWKENGHWWRRMIDGGEIFMNIS